MSEIDPTNSTDPRIGRGLFIGGLAASAATAAALAETRGPAVPEDDPAITVEHVELQRPDGVLPAYTASPRDAGPNTPGVVVVMHVWGVDASIRDVVRRLAKAGFAATAPNLYARLDAPSGDGVTDFKIFAPYAQKLQTDQVDADLRAAALWLKDRRPQGKVGVLGFCMGGGIALRQAVDNGDVFSADAVWYGKVASVDASKVRIPVVGSFGGRDTSIPAEGVHEFAQALSTPNDMVVYPNAGHAFFDYTRASYVPDAAADSWRRVVSFLTKYLA